MDFKISFIYIAETQRSRKIMSKYSYLLSHERQDSSVRAVQLEYLGRYKHHADTGIVLYSKLFHISCITVIYSRHIINLIKAFHWHCPLRALFEE